MEAKKDPLFFRLSACVLSLLFYDFPYHFFFFVITCSSVHCAWQPLRYCCVVRIYRTSCVTAANTSVPLFRLLFSETVGHEQPNGVAAAHAGLC